MNILKKLENLAEGAFQEFKTTEFICDFLEKNKIINFINCNPGVYGTINANRDKTIAIRADIDALPLDNEKTKFKHLCGHHAHTAILLQFLKYAQKNRDKLNYNLRFIFQPAEEIGKGAEFLMEKGALENVNEIYSLHVDPQLNLGELGLKKGYLFAGAKFFDLEIIGKSTHAAWPHKGIDVFTVLGDFLNKIQTIIARFKDPVKSGVFSIGKISGGHAYNIIPDKVEISGTFRFFEEEVKQIIEDKLYDLLGFLKDFYGIDYNLNFSSSTIPLKNDNNLVDKLLKVLKKSEFKIIEEFYPIMGSEDFSFYIEKVPGVYFRLGIKEGEDHPPLHNIDFYVSEKVIEYGVNLWKYILF